MKIIKTFLYLLLFFFVTKENLKAQTFTGSGGSIITLTDTSRFNIAVSGIAAPIDFNYGLESVTINISHTQDKDIDCFLAAPDGTLIELTTDNGGTGDDFTNTVFRQDASTSITAGTAPFTGTYKPEGELWRVNNNQNANGTWQLRVIDDANNFIAGSLINWSVKFSSTPALTFIFSQSSLPIVIINTNGQNILDNPKIIVDMKIIDHGNGVRNYLTDTPNNYDGKIAIEIRGSSSQSFPKKSFGFETMDGSGLIKVDTSLLGMPTEHDWILSANYTDKSFCRNMLSYQLSMEMGHYAVRTKFVDVVLNGQYWGIYVFMESLKRDKNRVDISKLQSTEITAPNVTGGYIVKIDKSTGSGGAGWTSAYAPINHSNGQSIFIQYDYPSTDSIVPAQQAYIKSYVDSFENALAGANFRDSILGYQKYIGNGSWIDYFFSNELSKNVDGYRISSYLYKDKEKTLKAGPVWDYDIAYGNANYCNGNDTTGWAYLFSCTGDSWQIPFWWQKLLLDTNYTNQVKCRWTNYRNSVLSLSHINGVIDSVANLLNESQGWNFTQWPILGTYVWPNPSPQPSTYAGEIQNLKNWMATRLSWLDANMPGHCNCSVNIIQQNVTCATSCDGQLLAVGTSPYQKTYVWENGDTTSTLIGMCAGTQSVQFTDAVGCTRTSSATITAPAILSVTTSVINAPCNSSGCDGQAIAAANGGVSPYQYAWSDGQTSSTASGLCSGSYSVIVTDAHGCSKAETVNVLIPSAPVITINNVTNANCFNQQGGSASVSASGGIGPYSYSWSPSGGNNSTASNLLAGTYLITVTDSVGCPTSLSVTISQPPPLILSTSVTDVRCYGTASGAALASASGGSGGYQYSWMPGNLTGALLNNVSSGLYSVTLSDANNCTRTESIVISDAPLINATISTTQVSCHNGFDGSATVVASGGTGSLSYFWDPVGQTTNAISGLSPGVYTVIVSDSFGCTVNNYVTLSNPILLTFTSSSSSSTCLSATGSAQVNVSGGSLPYGYLWQPNGETTPSIINLSAGNYSVTITDGNSCVTTGSVVVNSESGMTVNVFSQTNVSCYGDFNGSASLQVSGGRLPLTYTWSPNGGNDSVAANLAAGNYSIEVSDADGCTTIQQLTIQEPAIIDVSASWTDVSCYGGNDGVAQASVSGGTGPYVYLWSPIGGTSSIASNLPAGTYSVQVTDQHNCTASQVVQLIQPTQLFATASIQNTICDQPNGSIKIHSSGGTLPYTCTWTPSVSTLDSAINLPSGTYSVVITDAAFCSSTLNVVVNATSIPHVLLSSVVETSCNSTSDGSITLLTTGGVGSYSYLWFPNVSNSNAATLLQGGIYSIVVTDSLGCRDSIGVLLAEPAPLGALMIPYDVSCFGSSDGKILADVGGGTAPYSYLWSPSGQTTDSAINLLPGTYSLLMTDAHGCTSVATAQVQSPDPILVNSTSSGHTCFSECNGFAEVSVSGGSAPYTYLWCDGSTSSAISNACSGNCAVEISDALGCIETRQFSFAKDDSLSLIISHTNATCTSCTDGSADVFISGGFPPYSYSWTPGNFTTANVTGLIAGTYVICITDSNACIKCDSVVILEPGIGTNEIKSNSPLYVYPNPANDFVFFAFVTKGTQFVSIDIFEATGKKMKTIFTGNLENGEHFYRLETSDFAPGVYLYTFTSGNSRSAGVLVIGE